MSKLPTNHPNGISLLESVVAISILLIGLFAVIRLFPLGLAVSGDSQRVTAATNFSQAQLEELLTLPYDQLTVGSYEPKGRISNDAVELGYSYQRETTIEYLDENLAVSQSDTGLKRITVTTYWISAVSHDEQTVSLRAIRAFY